VALSNPAAIAALRLFDAVMSQWRTSFGGIVGLDYPAAFQVAPVIGVEVDGEVFSYLRVLEAEQLEAWTPAEQEGKSR